jgi:hypothetical protein
MRSNISASQLLHGAFQLRVSLPDDFIKLRRLHTCFLELREGTARFDRLVLARVAD